jgi:hypothetical protein
MADTKITALTALTAADPASDVLPIVDISDTTMAASGTTKKISVNNILGAGGTATLASAAITGAATVGTTLGVTGGATVGGTLGVTGAATFTGPVVCNGAVTLGDAVGDAINATGSLTSYTGQAPSAIRAAASDYAAVNVRWGDGEYSCYIDSDGSEYRDWRFLCLGQIPCPGNGWEWTRNYPVFKLCYS